MNIDFSKAPEGATHYLEETDKTYLIWVKNVLADSFEINCPEDGLYIGWSVCSEFKYECSKMTLIEIPHNKQSLTVTCNNEHEVMICEQALRMMRGVASERLVGFYWDDASNEFLSVHEATSYRAKPKKELVVPWDLLVDEVAVIRIDKDKNVWDGMTPLRIKLDLTDIELPVTVKRPE